MSTAYFNEEFEIFNSNEDLKNNANKMVDLYPSIDLDPDESFQQPPTKKHHFSKLDTMDLNLDNLINKNNLILENKLNKYQSHNDQQFFNCLQYQPVINQSFDSSINNYSHLANYIEENNNISNLAYQKYTYQNSIPVTKEDSISNYVSTVKNSNSVTKILPKQMTNESSCLGSFNMNDSKDQTDYNQYFNPYDNYHTGNSMQDINNSNINQNIDSQINFNNNNLQMSFSQNPNRQLSYNENINNDLINNDINKNQNNLMQNTIHNHNSILNQVSSSPVSLQKSPLSTNSFIEDSAASPLNSSLKIDLNETTKTVESKKKRVYIPVSKFKFSIYIETKPVGELMDALVNEIVNFVFEYVPMNRKTPKPIDGLLGFIIGRYPILAEENRTGFDSLKSLVHVEMKRRMSNLTKFETKTQSSD